MTPEERLEFDAQNELELKKMNDTIDKFKRNDE